MKRRLLSMKCSFEINHCQTIFEENMYVVLPADDLAKLIARTSAATLLAKFKPCI